MSAKKSKVLLGVGAGLILILPLLGTAAAPTRNEQSSVTGSLRPSARDAEGEVNDLQFLFGGVEARTATLARLDSAVQPRVDQAYGKLPLSFEANRGQTDSQVKFLSRGGGSTLF